MKIAFISQPFDTVRPPNHNSIGLWIYEVARRLATSHNVTIYTRGQRLRSTREQVVGLTIRGVATGPDIILLKLLKKLKWLWPNPRRPQFASWLHYFGYALQMALDLKRDEPDIVHILNFSQFVPVIRFFNPSCRIVLHMQAEWLSQLDRSLVKPRLDQADLIVGCSDHITHLIQARYPELRSRCATVHNGVDVSHFGGRSASLTNPPHNSDQVSRDSSQDTKKRLLFLGRISPEKGVHILLEAFAQVARQMPDVHLDLVGPHGQLPLAYLITVSDDPDVAHLSRFYQGDDRNAYVKYLQLLVKQYQLTDRVSFSGPVSHHQIADYLRQADLLVNPSLSESFGIGVIEAMACGLPVVATPVGGLQETIQPEKTGLLVAVDDADALADAIIQLLRDAPLRRRLGQAGRQRAHALFGWEMITSHLETLYQTLREPACRVIS